MPKLTNEEIEELFYAVAERKNPFTMYDVCDYLNIPKYCRLRYLEEMTGINPSKFGRFLSIHPDFEKSREGSKNFACWTCISIKNEKSGTNAPVVYSDSEIEDVLYKVSREINPFNFADICEYFGFHKQNTSSFARIYESLGITPSRVGKIVSKNSNFDRVNSGTHNRVMWCYKKEEC